MLSGINPTWKRYHGAFHNAVLAITKKRFSSQDSTNSVPLSYAQP
jgi:hypothetical protein